MRMRKGTVWAAVVVIATAAALVPVMASAQGSTYVPLSDPAYRDLDLLVSAGLVSDLILRHRPYSRMTFARACIEARAALEPVSAPGPRTVGVLTRLESRFHDEIARLSAGAGPTGPRPASAPRLREVAFLSSWADNPPRVVPTGYHQDVSYIDADIAPLLQRNLGRESLDGGMATVAVRGDLALGSRMVASLAPRVWLNAFGAADADAGFQLEHGYVRGVLGNLSVTVGRNALTHGHARELGPALSTNGRGLDMVRLSMERPARLPWIFRHLGPASFGGTLATMGNNRDQPGSVLVVWEAAIRPHPNLELGATAMNQQGGEGAPEGSFKDRLFEAFFLHKRGAGPTDYLPPDPQIGDKLMGVDARLTLPGPQVTLFAEVITTDDHDLFFKRPRESFWTEAAWAVGIRRYGLGTDGRLDLWTEAGHVGVRTYTHHQITSGITLDRRVLGSPLGPLSAGVVGGLDWNGPADRVSVAGAWERYQGDTYAVMRDPDWRWARVEDNPDEIRVRATLDWARKPAVTGLRTTVRLGYEHVTRFDFTDRNRSNLLAQVGVGWVW